MSAASNPFADELHQLLASLDGRGLGTLPEASKARAALNSHIAAVHAAEALTGESLRRLRLRAALSSLIALDSCVQDSNLEAENAAVEVVIETLKSNFGKDYLTTCEGCSEIVLIDDQGQRCAEGEILCADCAMTWGEIKAQWDGNEISEESAGQRERFMTRYDAHIASGGKPEDRLLYAI